ncbi:CHASE3 domain-containing protein [Actinopolymorpha sp. B9G3]|uniref:CHASE3 domain-containing protein n=1 Tax=Actinopolymorpha sp. B9G3 TaxID=3158970 RepID=UPI0032D8DE7D
MTGRMIGATGLLTAIVSIVFALLVVAVSDMRESAEVLRHSRERLAAANLVERDIIDLETGVRGFVITREERYLEPWDATRFRFPADASELVRLADQPGQRSRARRVLEAGTSYIQGYAAPLVSDVRQGDASASSVEATEEGRRRVNALRRELDGFAAVERVAITASQERADADARQAIVAASVGFAGSIVLVVLFAGYLTRAIVGPVRRVAAMAGRLAGGDLSTRMSQTGVGEIGALERSFNSMAESLQRSRDGLRRINDEQAALRRVATIVAQGRSPDEVFAAVAKEVGLLLGAEATRLLRFEADGRATVMSGWTREGDPVPAGGRIAIDGIVAAMVRQSGQPARKTEQLRWVAGFLPGPGPYSAVGSPIMVEGKLWGAATALSPHDRPMPQGADVRMGEFTGLVGTAIANTQARAELTASRARIVAAADQTRRQIERDLHDGIQQRLVSLTINLRAVEASVPPELPELRADMGEVVGGLIGALEDLRETSRGIHPAILSEGGLGPALKTLARRSTIPVELDVEIAHRLSEPVEAAAYYVAAEALANAAKHAHASVARVEAGIRDGRLHMSVRDDGVGGADPVRGSGLIGLTDRVEAMGGSLEIISPSRQGTLLQVELPVEID